MDSDEKTKSEINVRARVGAVKTAGIILGSAILGSVVTVVIIRFMQGGAEPVSTIALLSFSLMLGLSVSAIVLAVSAIALSRSSERIISRKSEEMSAMQTTMVAQTVAAIERMESSVQRIGEELSCMIYDNFEMLAGELQERIPSRDILHADVMESVERALSGGMIVAEQQGKPEKDAVADEAPATEPEPAVFVEENAPLAVVPDPEPPPPEPVTDEMRERADKKYGEFKDIVLLGVANYPGVISRKIGEGQYRTEGDELADGVFIIQNEKVAVCTFCIGAVIADRFIGETGDSFTGFLKSLFNELKRGHFTRVFMVFDGQLTSISPYAKALNGLSGRIDADTFSRFELFEGTPDVVIPELTERVSQLMEEPLATDEEPVQELCFRRQASA